jgi:hypothetical protein
MHSRRNSGVLDTKSRSGFWQRSTELLVKAAVIGRVAPGTAGSRFS